MGALDGGPAPSEALAGSLPGGSQASPTDPLVGQTESAPAPLSGGSLMPSPETGLADEPGDDPERHGRKVRFVYGRTSQFARKRPSFDPGVADTFARSPSRRT